MMHFSSPILVRLAQYLVVTAVKWIPLKIYLKLLTAGLFAMGAWSTATAAGPPALPIGWEKSSTVWKGAILQMGMVEKGLVGYFVG
jgi:hypothetical protein